MPDSIGNTLNTAQSIVLGSTQKFFSDSVEFNDNDYYRFTLKNASSFSLSLSGLSANANVELLNSAGAVVTVNTTPLQSLNTGTLVESINAILDPGTYYIRVFPGAPTDPLEPAGTTPSTNYTLGVQIDNGIHSDLLWRYYVPDLGYNGFWHFDGTELTGFGLIDPSIPDIRWQIVGAGDFNHDGQTDILWRFHGDDGVNRGSNGVWLMNNGTLAGATMLSPEPDLNFSVQGVADFNQDGHSDIIWQSWQTGEVRLWLMNGFSVSSVVKNIGPAMTDGWYIGAVGDFNADNNPDIMWANVNHSSPVPVWFMNGATLASSAITISDPNKFLQGSGDFNGDSQTDLVWRDYTTGANEIWLMNGINRESVVPISEVADTNWFVIGSYQRFESIHLADIAGSTPATAFAIGPLNGNGVYQEEVGFKNNGNDDYDDYYQFSLGSNTRLNLLLDGLGSNALQGDLDVQILNASGAIVREALNRGTGPESLTDVDLAPGTYYIHIYPGQTGAASAYDLHLQVNNLPVLVSSGPLTITEGTSQTLSNTLLMVTDENNEPTELTYTLVTPPNPTNGNLSLNGAALTTGSVFTQADINKGKITYQQNGGETLVDTFVFGVSDGQGGTIANTTFTVNVIPTNDSPVLRSLNGITVSENQAVTISNTSLLLTDVEQSPLQLIYSLNSLPTQGTLSLGTAPLTAGSTFTQADINGNRLTYKQNGSEATRDVFTFTATDGAGGFLNPQIQTLSVNIIDVNDAPVLVSNLALTVTEGGPKLINNTLLQATDAEFTTPAQQDNIKFSIANLPTRGTLFLNGTAQTTPFTFSQADLNANRLTYLNLGNETNSDKFTFTISDGIATVPTSPNTHTFEIFVQGVSGPPVLSTNKTLSISEGSVATIANSVLKTTDPDSASAFITYSLASLPTNGQLLHLGTALTTGATFSQADIDSGKIEYKHNGSEQPATDTFTFSVKDETGAGPTALQTFSFNITSVNDLPVLLTTNSQLTVTEGTTVSLTSNILKATDNDNLAQQITYTLVAAPAGSLLLNGTAVSTFTQLDVDSGLLKYAQGGSESAADAFTFRVTDQSGTLVGPGTLNIQVIPANDAPGLISLAPLTVSEGQSATFSNTQLLITDADGPGPITYTLGNGPSRGFLKRGNITLSNGSTFTQADIASNQLVYVNNGSEATSDSFTFTASDGATTGVGAPGVIPLTTFSINVTPVNDAPSLVSNTGLTLSEGANATINGSRLNVTDAESQAPGLTYSVIEAPVNGTLLKANTQVSTFTQADLNGNLITYQHNGSESVIDSFVFEVVDSDGGGTEDQTFNISVLPVNDAPRIATNAGLTLSEGSSSVLSDLNLSITDPDGPSPTVLYTLGGAPTQGVLVSNGVTLTNGRTFTQADLTGGQISYVHNGSETTSDRFTFTASDGSTGQLGLTTFSINVTPVNDTPVVTTNAGLTLSEGTNLVINGSRLNSTDAETVAANLTYSLIADPANGTLLKAGTQVSSFTQADLNAGAITYQHNGSESVSDDFVFEVLDSNAASTGMQSFNINVLPVNDVPKIVTNTGLSLNEGGTGSISDLNLLVTDADGPSPTVLYTLSGAPTQGVLVSNGVTLTNGRTFTQADIAAEQLSYVHSGSETTSDRFTFTASDGSTGQLGLTTFSLTVTSLNDSPTITVPTLSAQTVSVNEDQTFTFTATNNTKISVTDPDGGPSYAVTLGTSSGGTINLGTTSGLVGLSGNGSNLVTFSAPLVALNNALNNLKYKGGKDFNGTDLLGIEISDGNGGVDRKTVTMNVVAVNDTPTFTVPTGTISIQEDQPTTPLTITVTDPDADPNPIKVTLKATNGTISLNDTTGLEFIGTDTDGTSTVSFTGLVSDVQSALAGITYQGKPDYFGSDRVIVTIDDMGGTGAPGGPQPAPKTISINVTSVNDKPTFTGNGDVLLLEDAPNSTTTFANWAKSISTGTPNENQTLTFNVTSADTTLFNNLFSTAPTIDPTTGNLVFKTKANANGTIALTATLRDNGGTLNGGIDVSDPFIFTAAIAQVNDAPSFTKGINVTINEDATTAGPITISNWASNIKVGPTTAAANESTQTPTFLFETSNPSLFSGTPQINVVGTNGNLVFTPAPDQNGTAVVTVRIKDDGSTDNGGADLSPPQSFTVVVRSVNDAPTFSSGITNVDVLEDDGPQSISLATDISVGPANEASQTATFALTNSNPNLFLTAPKIDPATGLLTFTSKANTSGSAVVTAILRDNGGTANGGQDTSTPHVFTINVAAINDAPTFTKGGNQNIDEDGPAQTINNWATQITAGSGETGQSLSFLISNDNPNLFTVQPTLSPTGTLTYTAAPNANGVATVSVVLQDNGGTANEGVDTSAVQIFTIGVAAVNDGPTLTLPSSVPAITEDDPNGLILTGATAIQLTDIDSGNNPIRVVFSATKGSILLPSANGLNVVGGSNGGSSVTFTGTVADFTNALSTVVYRPNANFSGNDTLTVRVDDQGFTGKGGAKTVSGAIAITVNADNDPPVLLTNNTLTVSESSTTPQNVIIGNSLLKTTDVESAANRITYVVGDTPDFGQLRLSTGSGFVALSLGSTFTQADIDSSRLRYAQDGSESTADSFTFQVSDGGALQPAETFNITILPLNDPPNAVSNTGLTVTEESGSSIISSFLQFTDPDNADPSQIVYTIDTAPSSGFVGLGGDALSQGQTFTQADIDNGLISYLHNGSETTSDTFNFSVSDGTSTVTGSFNIAVVNVNDAPSIVSDGPLTVNEAGSVKLQNILVTTDPDNLTSQIRYTLAGQPIFGSLTRNSTTLSIGSVFTQDEINTGLIAYQHNGSEQPTDAFTFQVSDGTSTDSGIVNISVTSVNDAPVLINNLGLGGIPAGIATTKIINTTQLRATDADNPANEVRFKLDSLPSLGAIRLNGTPLSIGQTFTQKDIADGKVTYRYNGTGSSDGFQFTVVDALNKVGGSGFFAISFTS